MRRVVGGSGVSHVDCGDAELLCSCIVVRRGLNRSIRGVQAQALRQKSKRGRHVKVGAGVEGATRLVQARCRYACFGVAVL